MIPFTPDPDTLNFKLQSGIMGYSKEKSKTSRSQNYSKNFSKNFSKSGKNVFPINTEPYVLGQLPISFRIQSTKKVQEEPKHNFKFKKITIHTSQHQTQQSFFKTQYENITMRDPPKKSIIKPNLEFFDTKEKMRLPSSLCRKLKHVTKKPIMRNEQDIKTSVNEFYKILEDKDEDERNYLLQSIRQKFKPAKQNNKLKLLLKQRTPFCNMRQLCLTDKANLQNFQMLSVNNKIPLKKMKKDIIFNSRNQIVNDRILVLLGIDPIDQEFLINSQQYISIQQIQHIHKQSLDQQSNFLYKFFMIDPITCGTPSQFRQVLRIVTSCMPQDDQADALVQHFFYLFKQGQVIQQHALSMDRFKDFIKSDPELLNNILHLLIDLKQ